MPRKKKLEEGEVAPEVIETCTDCPEKTEKEKLLELHAKLVELGIHSIGDLENKIANCR